MKPAIVGILILGLVLFAASGLWSTMFPVTNSWTPEKSEQLANVKDRMTNISFVVNNPRGRDTSALKAELEQLTKDDARLTAEFQSAFDRPNTISKIFKWSGISLAVVGIIGWYAVNQSR
jgi:hypothetical protein